MAKKIESKPVGRPREHDREQIAIDLIAWAQRPDSINLCGFCAEQLLVPSKISQWAKENTEFRQTYELAKAMIGDRREKHLNAEMLHVKAYDLNAKTYDHFLKEEHRQQMEYEAALKANENQQVNDDISKQYQATMSLLSDLQSNARKSSDIKSKSDKKS